MSTDGDVLTYETTSDSGIFLDAWPAEADDAGGWAWEMRFRIPTEDENTNLQVRLGRNQLSMRIGDGENTPDNPQDNYWFLADRIVNPSADHPGRHPLLASGDPPLGDGGGRVIVAQGDFTQWHRFSITQQPGSNATNLFLDGEYHGNGGDGFLEGGDNMWIGGGGLTRGFSGTT